MITYQAALHQTLCKGERQAWAWGVSKDAHIQLTRAPYRFEGVIDGLHASGDAVGAIADVPVYGCKKLSCLNPKKIVIVVFADINVFAEQIERQVAAVGVFELTRPFDYWQHHEQETLLTPLLDLIKPRQSKPLPQGQNRILLALPNLFKGGADKQMVLLALGLKKQGHDVTLFTYGEDAKGTVQWQQWLRDAGVKREHAKDISLQSQASLTLEGVELSQLMAPRFANMLLSLVALIQKIQPDICISFMDNMNLLLGMANAYAGQGVTLMSCRSQAPVDVPGFETMLDFSVMCSLYQLLLVHDNNRLLCNSDSGRESYAAWIGLDIKQIACIANALYLEAVKSWNIRARLNISESALVVCGVMRLIESKRPLMFIDVVYQAKLKCSNIVAVIVGDGPLYKAAQQRIDKLHAQDYIKLVGLQESALPFLAESDALLHTSCVEGTANVLLEAKALKVPVYGFDSTQTIDALNSAQCYLSAEGDQQALANLLAKTLCFRNSKVFANGEDFDDVQRMAREYVGLAEQK